MWKAVLLNERFTLSLLKSAISTGDVALIAPQTESEKQQLSDLRKKINRSQAQSGALLFSLLADHVYLDGANIGWRIFQDMTNDDDYAARIAVASATPECESFIRLTDSGPNYWRSGSDLKDSRELANLFTGLEPFVWRSISRQQNKDQRIRREELRNALDVLAVKPELIDLKREVADIESFRETVYDALRQLAPNGHPSTDEVRRVSALCHLTITKGFVASNAIHEATIREAIYPVDRLTFGKDRRADVANRFNTLNSEEVIAAARVFLEEISYWPIAEDFSDVLRIRQDRHFTMFRDTLRTWVGALLAGDTHQERQLRSEIHKANSSLRRAITCSKIAGLFTYLGLPLLVLDALTVPVFGQPATVTGFGLQAYADWLKSKNRWLVVGK